MQIFTHVILDTIYHILYCIITFRVVIDRKHLLTLQDTLRAARKTAEQTASAKATPTPVRAQVARDPSVGGANVLGGSSQDGRKLAQ